MTPSTAHQLVKISQPSGRLPEKHRRVPVLTVGYHSSLWRSSEGKKVCSHGLFSPLGGQLPPHPGLRHASPPLPDPRTAGAEAIRFTLKRECGRQNPAQSAWQDSANAVKLLYIPRGAGSRS